MRKALSLMSLTALLFLLCAPLGCAARHDKGDGRADDKKTTTLDPDIDAIGRQPGGE